MKKLKRRLSQKIGRLSSNGNDFVELGMLPPGEQALNDDSVFFSSMESPLHETKVVEMPNCSGGDESAAKKGNSLTVQRTAHKSETSPKPKQPTHLGLERCSSSPASILNHDPSSPYGEEMTYHKMEILGEGSYATVYRGQSRRTGQIVALKEISLNPEEGAPFTAIREASLLRTLRHANVVTLHDIIHTKTLLTFVFEYMVTDLGMYMDWYGNNEGINCDNCILFTFQLLRGLAYCHRRRILHRDIKPQNLLINEHGELKLADFGLARAKSFPTNTYSHEVVTLWYRPPDVLLGSRDYTTSLDMWGVGCIFLEMLKGTPIFPGKSNAFDQLKSIFKVMGTPTSRTWPALPYLPCYAKYLECFQPSRDHTLRGHVSRIDEIKLAYTFATNLLKFEPSERLSAEQAMKHPIFSQIPQQVFHIPDRTPVTDVKGVIFTKEVEKGSEEEVLTMAIS